MNKILIAVAIVGLAGSGVAAACQSPSCSDGGRHGPDAGSESYSGTNTFGSANGGGSTVNNQRPAGAFQSSKSHAFNETRAGAEADRSRGRTHLDVDARIESAGHTSSSSEGTRFGRDSFGSTSGFARQSGDADAYATGRVRDRHSDTTARGGARVGVSGWQNSESYTSNINNGTANSDASGRFSGTVDAEIDVDADHDHAHVRQHGDTDVSAGGESETSKTGRGYADGSGYGEVEGGTRTRARTVTGSGADRTYRIIDSLDDGTYGSMDGNSHDPD